MSHLQCAVSVQEEGVKIDFKTQKTERETFGFLLNIIGKLGFILGSKFFLKNACRTEGVSLTENSGFYNKRFLYNKSSPKTQYIVLISTLYLQDRGLIFSTYFQFPFWFNGFRRCRYSKGRTCARPRIFYIFSPKCNSLS